jgi:hypothetical protein
MDKMAAAILTGHDPTPVAPVDSRAGRSLAFQWAVAVKAFLDIDRARFPQDRAHGETGCIC